MVGINTGLQRTRLDLADEVAVITLADPDVGNGLDPYVMEAEIADALRMVDRDRNVRAIVVAGQGSDFCVGAHHDRSHNPRYPQDAEATAAERLAHGWAYGGMWDALSSVHKPMIAAVRGRCAAGGLGIALACDVIIAGESAQLIASGVDAGRSPFGPVCTVLCMTIGKHRTLELLWQSRPVGATEARSLGLVHSVVPDDECDDAAIRYARELANRPPISVSLARHLIRKAVDEDRDHALTRSLAYHCIASNAGST
jgi:enoyl-CoA hydratase